MKEKSLPEMHSYRLNFGRLEGLPFLDRELQASESSGSG
jgi:hypothetical protein